MTKNNQKFILIFIVILLVFTSVMAVFISMNIKDNNNDDQNNNIPSNKPVINKEISRLNNDEEYFAVQNAINYFYTMIHSSDKDETLSILDNEFVNENGINKDNLLEKFNLNNLLISFISEEIYYNDNSNITYYFIKGYIIESPVEEGNISYSPNKYYLLIVDMNNHFVIKPLDNVDNLETYAKSYDIKEVAINNNTDFKKQETSDKNRIINYINNFVNLLYLDTSKAYDMLDDETKKQYTNLDSFINDIDNIYSKLFTNFKALNKEENADNIIYKAQNKDMETISITEYYPNDYKIGFKFLEGV